MGEEGPTHVKRRRHTPEQVIRKLREADRMLGEAKTIPEVAKALEISENTYHRWQRQFGGMKCRRRQAPEGARARERALEGDRGRPGARGARAQGRGEGKLVSPARR